MIQDLRQLADGEALDTDVAIVGGGAAGIALARALAGAPFRVCLIESGGLEPDEAIQKLAEADNAGLPYGPIEATRLRYFGGTTNHWGGWCRPLDDIDFQKREWVPLSGWPIGRADLDPYYAAASGVCEAGPFAYDDVDGWEARLGMGGFPLPGAGMGRRVIQFSPPTRFGERYRAELEAASNLLLLLHANLVEIRATDNAAEVAGLALATLDGRRHGVSAKLYVLAAGGIENARLLLLSNQVQTEGLGNGNDMVGRCFMEHPHVYSMANLLLRDVSAVSPLNLDEQETDGTGLRGNFMPSEAFQRRERIQNATFTIGISARFPSRDDVPVAEEKLTAPLLDLLHAWAGRSAADGSGVRIGIGGAGEQRPNPDSRVTLSGARDALGLRRGRLDWRLSPEDKASLVRNLRALGAEFAAAGLGRLHVDLPPGESWPDDLTGGNHHMGTTRMAADPRDGVVDANCRVHGLANLYVAGSSVFPTCGAANPTLTLVALALRLADHIRERMA
jgi:choline dehydrogenase-like flavoprotein